MRDPTCPPTPEELARRTRHGRIHRTFGTACGRFCRDREDHPICDEETGEGQCMEPAVEACLGRGYCVRHWGSATVVDRRCRR